jgi:hypothetical protein
LNPPVIGGLKRYGIICAAINREYENLSSM